MPPVPLNAHLHLPGIVVLCWSLRVQLRLAQCIVNNALISHLTAFKEKLVLPECKHVSERALSNFLRPWAQASESSTTPFVPLELLDVRFACEMPSDLLDNGCIFQDDTSKPQGTAVNWTCCVRQRPVCLQDTPWGGQPKASYSGWNPEVLSQYILDRYICCISV